MHDQARARQKGVATLVVSVGVALLMAVAAVGMMRSGLLEQKIAANDIRAREAQEIAQAGWEYVLAAGTVTDQACPSDMNISGAAFDFALPENFGLGLNQGSGENYIKTISWCYQNSGGEKFYFARSAAKSVNSGASAFVEGFFKRESILNAGIPVLPPFFVNGDFCTAGNSNKCNGNPSITGMPPVLATGSVDVSSFGISNSSEYTQPNVLSDKNATTAWDYVFGISIEEAKLMAGNAPGNPFYYFNDGRNINNSTGDLGSLSSPVVLIVSNPDESKCSNINGSIKIYGIVYFGGACKANGWGNSTIYGSVVSDGDIYKLNATSNHYKISDESWNALSEKSLGTTLIPGTWKDFEIKP
jgi:hypothetical protein